MTNVEALRRPLDRQKRRFGRTARQRAWCLPAANVCLGTRPEQMRTPAHEGRDLIAEIDAGGATATTPRGGHGRRTHLSPGIGQAQPACMPLGAARETAATADVPRRSVAGLEWRRCQRKKSCAGGAVPRIPPRGDLGHERRRHPVGDQMARPGRGDRCFGDESQPTRRPRAEDTSSAR